MEFNKLIYILLVISLITSFISTSLLFSQSNNFLTAQAVTGQGYIRMKIYHVVGIVVPPDESIVFGKCIINKTREYILVDSAGNSTDFNNGDCMSGVFPDYMDVKNSGNVNAKIEVSPMKSGGDFFNDNDSWYAYAFQNLSEISGCIGYLQSNYINFTNTSENYIACSNLTPNSTIRMSVRAYVTVNASGGGESDIKFIAYAS